MALLCQDPVTLGTASREAAPHLEEEVVVGRVGIHVGELVVALLDHVHPVAREQVAALPEVLAGPAEGCHQPTVLGLGRCQLVLQACRP